MNDRILSTLMAILMLLYMGTVFFPLTPSFIPISDEIISAYSRTVSGYLSPLLIATFVLLVFFQSPRSCIEKIEQNRHVLILAAIFVLTVEASMAWNGWALKPGLVSMNFLLVNIFLVLVVHQPLLKIEIWSKWVLFGWVSIPLLLVINPEFHKELLFPPAALDGFSSSRLIFGYWCGISFILVCEKLICPSTHREWKLMWLLITPVWSSLLVSQTRSVLVAIFAAVVVLIVSTKGAKRSELIKKLGSLGVYLIVVSIVTFIFWNSLFVDSAQSVRSGYFDSAQSVRSGYFDSAQSVRSGYFKVNDNLREEIYFQFIEILKKNWLMGVGGLSLIDIPSYGVRAVEAHNFVLQLWANYGVLALLAFVLWLVAMYRMLQSVFSKAMLVYLIAFSMFQPLLAASTNIFSPLVMMLFLYVVILEKKIRS